VGPIWLRLATEEHAKRKPLAGIFEVQGLMIPEMPPQRSAKPGFAPSSIIVRAAQHLDWTIAFGVRDNTSGGLEETTNQQPRPDPPGITRAARLRSGRAGRYRLRLTSRLCLASVVVAAAAGTGIFLLTHAADEKVTAKRAVATEAPTKASEDRSLIRGMALMPPAATTAQTATLAGQAPTPAASEWEAKLTFGSLLSPPGRPKSEVGAPPGKALEATSTVGSAVPRNQPIVPTFSVAETAGLLARGDWLFATGDISAARLLYERAADAGEARAAVRLGESFDPVYLDGSHLRGLQGDRDMALFWYRHARDLGATGVASRLKKLEAKQGRN
jgi:hypothetical protein